MKIFGIILLFFGLGLGTFSLTMDVSVDLPARDFGYGIRTPEARVANLDKMAQRQNYLISSGVVAVVGAILAGFGAVAEQAGRGNLVNAVTEEVIEEQLEDGIVKRNGVYAVGDHHFDTLAEARHFLIEDEALRGRTA